MIDLLIEHADNPAAEQEFLQSLAAHVAEVEASAGHGNRGQVREIEAAVQSNPAGSFVFDAEGAGTLNAATRTFSTGRFETPSIGDLRKRAAAHGQAKSRKIRLFVLDGASPATDIGSLQATAGQGTLFQVASQFNCLEAPSSKVTSIANYFSDPTQGPRASISAFPGTFLRHYSAPGPDGARFVQTTGGQQINLLEGVCSADVAQVRNGYLTSSDIVNSTTFAAALHDRFEELRIGVHDNVPVILGFNWDGKVQGDRSIGQVFTSTFAGGGYSRDVDRDPIYQSICTQFLRAAYLGTLLAAAALGRPKVVLTLIGGGVFGNPIQLIWDSILWSMQEVEQFAPEGLDVVVNGRNLGESLALDSILPAVRDRGGIVVRFGYGGVTVRR